MDMLWWCVQLLCPLPGDVRRAWGVWWRISRAEGACARASKSYSTGTFPLFHCWYLTLNARAEGWRKHLNARRLLFSVFLSIALFIVCNLRASSALFVNIKLPWVQGHTEHSVWNKYHLRNTIRDRQRGSLLIRRNTVALVLSSHI